jgi:AraC family transcriptional regulator
MREIGNTLRTEFRIRNIPSAVYLESLAGVIAIHLAQTYCRHGPIVHRTGLAPHKLKRVRTFITEHFSETIRVQQLAAVANMSPYHFARLFKQATGLTPHLYVTAQRLEYAKELLTESDLPLVEVGAQVGFQTQSHFTQVFHKHTGMTPRLFRLSRRHGAASMRSTTSADQYRRSESHPENRLRGMA